MTAVANPPSFAPINRPAWSNGSQSASDERSIFAPRKAMQRSNSSSSMNSNSSNSSTFTILSSTSGNSQPNSNPNTSNTQNSASASTGSNGLPITTVRKRPQQPKGQWSSSKQAAENQSEYIRANQSRQQMANGSSLYQLPPFVPGQNNGMSGNMNGNGNGANGNPNGNSMNGANGNGANGTNGVASRPAGPDGVPAHGQPVLYLVSLNGSFERKTISVPFTPDMLRVGRQTNTKTAPNSVNGYFDSKVLSRQHAEIWADRQGKVWIRDVKSSNGTFVNGSRLSAENRESEPHELQTNDHLELGIDIVSEDQKSVVHHKVSAKVEHAGFINAANNNSMPAPNPSNNLIDMNFGDLDPATGALMAGNQMGNMPFRGRTGSSASVGAAGRMAPAANMPVQNGMAAQQRNLWLTGPSTEAIVKKIYQEMRNAKQQSQDLQRTQEFIQALLSKEDIRGDANKAETGESSKPIAITNGNLSFRGDPKARFSDPPAPPPQQPLPEKPDVPSLKRASTERPKQGAVNGVPIRPENVAHLQDALSTARKELTTQHTRLKDLEDKLREEQEARKTAEDLARRLEEAASAAEPASQSDSEPKTNGVGKHNDTNTLAEAFELENKKDVPAPASTAEAEAAFRARIETMMSEMEGLKKQLGLFRERAEKAEAERDADRETLADMVKRIRQRDEENAKLESALASATEAAAAAAASVASADRKSVV